MRIGLLRLARALSLAGALLAGVRTPVWALAPGDCAAAAPSHDCCAAAAEEPCPPDGAMPCCRITRPVRSNPVLLTASGAAPALPVAALEPLHASPPVPAPPLAVRASARSSPLFLLHSALLV
jgi:hypothetical protein